MTSTNQTLCTMKRHILTAVLLLSATAVFSSMSFAHNTSGGCAKPPTSQLPAIRIGSLCAQRLNFDRRHPQLRGDCQCRRAQSFVGLNNSYRFHDRHGKQSVTNSAQERTIELNENTGISDPTKEVVSTVRNFNLEAVRTHSIGWPGELIQTMKSPPSTTTRWALPVPTGINSYWC